MGSAQDLFAYGVLMKPELLRALTGRRFTSEPAILEGFRRYAVVKEGFPEIPAIVPEPGSRVDGVLIREVDEASFRILDRFEEVETALYSRQRVVVLDASGQSTEAQAYVAGRGVLGSLAGDWNPTEFFDRYTEHYRTEFIPGFLDPATG
jgi:gamma-glutamylcyclotransferase (GGCT)/AIG2-like uncharacterized protein YtfP